jgi:arsenate reductase
MKNILFLCTGNSCRSIMAEAYFNHAAAGRWRAYSAGSLPTGEVHPMALATLQAAGILYSVPRSKSWDEFEATGAPIMNQIVTVCDNAANETCPIWPGHPVTAHWPFPDPAHFAGSESDRSDHFRSVFVMIRDRIDRFLQDGVA